jgi:outer membrane protein
LLAFKSSFGQEKWSLLKCVQYAQEHNISVKKTDLQARYSALVLKENRASQIPSLGLGLDAQYRFGLTENPTTGVLQNNDYFSAGVGLQSSVTLFNWFAVRNTIRSNRLTLEADNQETNKVKDDIALSVANAYLGILLAREQANIARNKVDLSKAQLENTKRQVEAGKLPELNAANLEAQLAVDSSVLVSAEGSVTQSLLLMKALLTLDAGTAFDVTTPPVESIPIESLADLQPEAVYTLALANLSQQKVNELRLQAAQKSASAARGRMFPSISASGSVGSNYVNLKEPLFTTGSLKSTGALATVGGTYYDVVAPDRVIIGQIVTPFGRQIRNNFGQTVGLSLNLPLFNGLAARTNWERAKLNVLQYELTKQEGDIQLKQDIYTAYTNAVSAVEKFNANKKAVETTQKVYDFAVKRYDIGLLSTFDLVTSQNNLQRAKYDLVYSQYDYVFKMKLLEYYKGQGLKL